MSTRISLMLAVDNAGKAADWYKQALGATQLWSLGSVIGLQIENAPFFLHEPTNRGFVSPLANHAWLVGDSSPLNRFPQRAGD